MEKKIKEIQDYFRAKMLSGDFKITSIDEHTLDLIIDEKYKFVIWVSNSYQYRKLYENAVRFIDVPFTVTQSKKFDSILKPHTDKFRNDILMVEKKKQLEQLKKELGEE